MKVNTDGVLLGAWAAVKEATSILDIGTGTGVIALMMAQKNTTAGIDAVEIDEGAYLQASDNFAQSIWAKRLRAVHTSLQNYSPEKMYDVIISNPPYFVADFKTTHAAVNVAKHSVALTYEELLTGVQGLLAENGVCYIAVPVFHVPLIETTARPKHLYITAQVRVTAVENKPPYLALLKLQRKETALVQESITIQHTTGEFTQAYRQLTADFYLKF